jgi:anti-sigma regulatory factor (Ser/Thr protein kinase)
MTYVGGSSDRARRPMITEVASAVRPRDAPGCAVDLESLAAVRSFVEQHARSAGLPADCVDDLVLAANELATNVVRHGGGHGRVWVWCADAVVFCQMMDRGPGLADADGVGELPSAPGALTGRGLWMIRKLTDRMRIDTGPAGTTVTVATAIDR